MVMTPNSHVPKDIKKAKFDKYLADVKRVIRTVLDDYGKHNTMVSIEVKAENEKGNFAEASSNANYIQGYVAVYPRLYSAWDNGDMEIFETCLIHEAMHIVLGILQGAGESRWITQSEYDYTLENTVSVLQVGYSRLKCKDGLLPKVKKT